MKLSKNEHNRKALTTLRAQADGYRILVHRGGHFDHVSPELWNCYVAAINAQNGEEWRQEGGVL
ncbi:MAG: hypothetical protein O2910_02560 [Proteobacteria bacterium]|nr:hypothetical protein [Pseudomonadota bacterium]